MAATMQTISNAARVDGGRRPGVSLMSLRAMQAVLVVSVTLATVVVEPRLSDKLADVLGYFVWGLAMLAGGVAALVRSKLSENRMKLRWMLLGISLCCGAGVYLFAASDNYFTALQFLDPGKIAIGAAGGAALMLSITVSFSGAPKGIIVLDLLQTALYITLSYVATAGANPWAKSLQSQLTISLLLALMLFLTAALAPLSATSREELSFFKILAGYLGAALVARFVAGQVGMIWMHTTTNFYVLPAIGVCTGMAVLLMDSVWYAAHAPRPDRELASRRLMLRNLMPSLLASASLLIALYVFVHAYVGGLVAVLSAVLLYLSRTLLLQTHMTRDALTLRHRNEQLEEITQRDALTGAGNRRSLAACFERCTEPEDETGDSNNSVGLLLVDLDFFKQANDLLGHLYGDMILTNVTGVLRSACLAVRGSHVARFGGDEFALLLPGLGAAETAEVAEGVRAGVAALAMKTGERPISVSIGGALTTGNEPLNEVIRRADAALYRAKLAGRDCVEFEGEGFSVTADIADEPMEMELVPII